MQLLLLMQSFKFKNHIPCIIRAGGEKKSINSPGNLGSHPPHHLSSLSSPKIQILMSANGLSTCKPSSLSCPEQSVFDKALEKALRCN